MPQPIIDRYLSHLTYEKKSSEHTLKAYRTDLSQFMQYMGDTCPTQASYQELRAYLLHLTEQPLSARSINRKLAAVKGLYNFLLRKGLIDSNPAQRLSALKQGKSLPAVIREDEMPSVLSVQPREPEWIGFRNRLIMELLYSTGIRQSELLGIRLPHINMSKQVLSVTGKRNKQRLIPINHTLCEIFSIYLSNRPAVSHDFLILTNQGQKAYPMLIHRIVKEQLALSQVEKKSTHTLRHTFATHMLNAGTQLNDIKELLGHANLAATQIYTHNSPERLKKVFRKAHPKAGDYEEDKD